MEPQVKQRITGAVVLVILVVILVPALLTGPRRASAPPSQEPGQPALQTYRSDLKAPSTPQTPANAQPVPPEAQHANADDAVAGVTAGEQSEPSQGVAPPVKKDVPKAAPPPKPAAVTKPAAAPASGGWAVQLGGFSSRPNAQKLVAELKEQGFGSYVADGSNAGHPLFRVRAGPVRDRAAADALLKRLKSKGHSGSVVTNP